MSDMTGVLKSKQQMRRKLAQLPLAQKLTMLDALRERHITLSQTAKRKSEASKPKTPASNFATNSD